MSVIFFIEKETVPSIFQITQVKGRNIECQNKRAENERKHKLKAFRADR
jgi:hypothetical protein